MLSKYKQLIALRNSEPVLKYGLYKKLDIVDDCIFFTRAYQDSEITVLINFGAPFTFSLPDNSKILLGTVNLQTDDFLIFK